MVTTHRDGNGFCPLVLLHTSNNLKARVIYLFTESVPHAAAAYVRSFAVGGRAIWWEQ